MRRKIIVFLMIFISFFIFYLKPREKPKATIGVGSQCAVLMESQSGRVLFEKNIHTQRPVASISKIMTAIVAIENADLEDYVTISKEATMQIGSSVYVKEGEKLKLKDLIYALMLRSGNDAAYAIAEYVGGDVEEFVYMMNEKAKELGLNNSTFENPSGLDETSRNISTAYDMAKIMRHAMNNPFFREINNTNVHRAKTLDGQYYVWENKHKLIKNYDHVIGGKTGYTELAKRTLVTVAKKDEVELIVVTLNGSGDWNDHMNLFDYGFEEYKMQKVLKEGIFEVKSLNQIFYLDENIIYPMSDDELSLYKIVIDFKEDRKKQTLMLVRENKVVYETTVETYDKSNSLLNDQITIKDLGQGILEFIREMFW